MTKQNNQLSKANLQIIKHNQQLHGVQHHRVTLDDDSAYHMKAKIKKAELDRLYGKIIEIEHELEINGGVI